MSATDIKILKVKMRGVQGCAKTEFLIAIARMARTFGMLPVLEGDGHNMAITSTRAQRRALYEFNHGQADGAGDARPLLPDGDVA